MTIEVKNLRKSYGSQLVLDDINFSIGDGEIVAFLGNNGAGKSTTMKIINGYLSKDSGDVRVCGIDVDKEPKKVHGLIGYLPEHNPIYPEQYVKEYLTFVAGVYGLTGADAKNRVDEMIEKTCLTREYKKRIGQLSKGYRQRVGLAAALIPDPKVLILDEPTTGLDPNQIIEVRNLIKEVGKEKSVMLSTHIMQEVSAICDRVIIINNGKIVADDSETNITNVGDDNSTFLIEAEFMGNVDINDLTKKIINSEIKLIAKNTVVISSDHDCRSEVFRYAVQTENALLTLKKHEKSMEDVFLENTKKN